MTNWNRRYSRSKYANRASWGWIAKRWQLSDAQVKKVTTHTLQGLKVVPMDHWEPTFKLMMQAKARRSRYDEEHKHFKFHIGHIHLDQPEIIFQEAP